MQDNFEEGLGYLINDLARLYRRALETALHEAELDLTPAGVRALYYVRSFPGLRQSALAECMVVEPMTLVNQLDILEQAGRVIRKVDPADRRAKVVMLTEDGHEVLEKALIVGRSVREFATKDLSGSEQAILRPLLNRMRDVFLPASALKERQ